MSTTTAGRGSITPGAPPGEEPQVAARSPRREELAAATVSFLRRGRPFNADLRVVDLGEGAMVVKDFADKTWWVRLMGRFLISYECRAYRRLGSMPGIPHFVGCIDREALALEAIDGVELTLAPNHDEEGERNLQQLRAIAARFKKRGFVHLDMRGRRNILRRENGEIIALDLAGAVWFRPRGFLHRLLSPLIDWHYEGALAKWKLLLQPDSLTDEDHDALRRFQRLRSLWIFNPKGRNKRK